MVTINNCIFLEQKITTDNNCCRKINDNYFKNSFFVSYMERAYPIEYHVVTTIIIIGK